MKVVRYLFLLVVMCVGGNANAQSSDTSYDSQACDLVGDITSPCNTGSEPFYQFISEFSSNQSFRESRVKFDADCDFAEDFEASYNIDFSVYELSRIIEANPAGYAFSLATWQNVTKNTVTHFSAGCAANGAFCWGVTYDFRRINGKWYLVNYEAQG